MLKEILTTPTEQLGKASRFLVFQIKLWSHCAKLLKKNRSGQQAAALAYHTIFGFVPLAVVTLLIFRLFPASSNISEKVKNLAYDQLQLSTIQYSDPANPDTSVKLTEHFDKIVSSIFENVDTGVITILGMVLVIYAALKLLSTIERAFNNIWHVAQGRNFLHRTINYWALLTLGPLLFGVGIYITTKVAIIGHLQGVVLAHIAPTILSYIIAIVAFFLLYFVLPNTKVQAKSAIWGAAVAALVWSVAKWGFGMYVTKFIPYSQVYGVMGLVPLGVFWIYITWLIALFGLQLTFTTQHLKTLDAAEIASAKKTEEYFIANDFTVINIVREIAAAFEANNAPVESEVICSKLNIPAEFGDKILNHLVSSGLIIKTSEPKVGFIPAQEPANIKLSDVAEAVAAACFGQPEGLEQIIQSQRSVLAQHNLKQIINPEQNG